MNRTLFFTLFLVIFSFGFLTAPAPTKAERIIIDLIARDAVKIKIAVPWLQNKVLGNQKQKFGRDTADTLAKALKFHGIIEIIPTSSYGGNPNSNWRKLGADYVVLGQYGLEADGVNFELRLFDVAGNEVIMGNLYSGTTYQKDSILYSFCDKVIKELTGTPGIANTQIAFVSRIKNNIKEIFLSDILGKKIRQVTRHNNLTVSPRFTPDGKFLSYTSYHSGNPNLYITELNQNKVTTALSRRKGMNLAPAWSPDGKKMILTLSVNGNPDLFLLDNRGKIIKQLTKRSGINVSPAFSPDGKKIVFVSDRSSKPQLYIMDLDSMSTQRLTFKGSENAEPSWSPDGSLIAYSSLDDGVYQIYTISPQQGATPKKVTEDLSHHESPSWSPDSNQIIFAKRDGKNHQIYAIMKTGSYQRRLFSLPGSQSYPQWSR